MGHSVDGRIPLTIVTGFLGSGKTTLIRHLLAAPAFASAALIVNELGEIGIDHHLFWKTEERTTLLKAGCACCSRREDLVAALLDLVRRFDRGDEPVFDRVVLETTGLADPAPILHTVVADPILSRRFRIETTITTLDAVAGEQNLTQHGEAMRQVTAADIVILTKCDLAATDAVEQLRGIVQALNPAASVVVADHGRVAAAQLLRDNVRSAPLSGANTNPDNEPPLLHAAGRISSLNLDLAEPLDWRMFGLWLTMLLHRHGERVLRVKGLLDVGGSGPLLVEGVQHVVHAPRHLRAWPSEDHRSQLVIICRDLDAETVRESLLAFQKLATRPAGTPGVPAVSIPN